MARSLFDVYDGRTFPDQEGGGYDGVDAVCKDGHLSPDQMSAGLSFCGDAFQLHIDVGNASDVRVMTATMLIVIEGSPYSAGDPLLSDCETSFAESFAPLSCRAHEVGITRHVPLGNRLVVAPFSANQGSR